MYMIIQGVQSVRQLKSRRPVIIQISFQGPKHKYNSLKMSWFLIDLHTYSHVQRFDMPGCKKKKKKMNEFCKPTMH